MCQPSQPSPSAHMLDVLNLFDNDKVNTAIGAMEAYADELFAAAAPQVTAPTESVGAFPVKPLTNKCLHATVFRTF